MGSDFNPLGSHPPPSPELPPTPPVPQEPSQTPEQSQQSARASEEQAKQAEQARQAQEAQAAEAKRIAAEVLRLQGHGLRLPEEFVGVLDTIVQEGYEVAKPPEGKQELSSELQGDLTQKNATLQSQKDLQMLREFIREAKYLVEQQGMEMAQMLSVIKVEQGGAFWQKIQQILQKGIPIERMVLFQKVDKDLQALSRNLSGSDLHLRGIMAGQTNPTELGQINPGRAILELTKAELNPQGQTEHFLLAFQILMRDGLQQSAQKLLSYLRRRGGMSEQEWQYFFPEDFRKEIFQGPMPREEIRPVNFWYVLLAIGAFGASIGLGLNLAEATSIGVSVGIVMFVLTLVFKK